MTLSVLNADKTAIEARGLTQSAAIRFARTQGIPLDCIMPAAEALEAVVPRRGVTMTDTGGVSAVAVKRQDKVDAAMGRAWTKLGEEFSPTAPLYQRGTRVANWGVDNFDKEQAWTDALPGKEALLDVADRIDAEDRRIIRFNIGDVTLINDDGRLLLRRESGKPGIPMTANLMKSLVSYSPEFGITGPGLYTSAERGGLDPDLKAEHFNRVLKHKVATRLKRRKKSAKDGGWLSLAVRRAPAGGWQAYHIASPRHTSHNGMDGAAFLRAVHQGMPDDLKLEIDYDPATTDVRFSAWTMPDHIVDLSAGDVFKGGISGGTSDVSGSFWGGLQFIRNLCLNLIILATETAEAFRISHNANPTTVQAAIRAGLAASDEAFNEIREVWGMLRQPMPGLDASDEDSVRQVLLAAAKLAKLPRQGKAQRDSSVELLLSAFNKEPGDSYADVLNAVTRLHFQADIDSFALARQGGEVMAALSTMAAEGKSLVPVLA